MPAELIDYMNMTARDYVKLLRYCIDMQAPEFLRLESLQLSYDNKIDPETWPSQSAIPTAQHFVMVEEALPSALDECFPESNGLQLIPAEEGISQEQVRSAEWALWTMVNYRMDLRTTALRSLKDCFKCGIGYGIVEPFLHTPEVSKEQVSNVGGEERKKRIMSEGDKEMSVQYRYISTGRVVPYPSGTDFNGNEATPISFFYDPKPLWEVEAAMNGDKPFPGIDPKDFLVTFKEVEELAVQQARYDNSDFARMALTLGGRRQSQRDTTIPGIPIDVPIVRVFIQPNIEIWMIISDGNNEGDGLILYKRELEGSAQMRIPLVKWSAWPDGDRWFPMSTPEADQMRGIAYDMFLNFFFDMMAQTKDAQQVINRTALGPNNREPTPGQPLYVEAADARTAMSYVTPPNVDPSIPAVGDTLSRLGDKIQGKTDLAGKNFTRGGTMAFNDLLNTTQARQRMAGMILELGALSQIYRHVLAFMQTMAQDGDISLRRTKYDGETGTMVIESKSVSMDDITRSYELLLDTTERRMLGGMSDQIRLQLWQELRDRDDVNPAEANRLCPLPTTTAQRVFKSKKQVDALQAENRDLAVGQQLAQTAAGGAGGIAGGIAGGGTPVEAGAGAGAAV